MTCFYTRRDYVALQRHGKEDKGILKKPTDFYKNCHDYPIKICQFNQYNTISSMRQKKFTKKNPDL